MKFLFFTLLVISSTMASAGEGNALLPHWIKSQDSSYNVIHVTNISGSTVTVRMSLYDMQGLAFDESSESGDNFDTQTFIGDPLSAAGATLEPNQTGFLYIKGEGPVKRGYGTIAWESTGTERVALITSIDRVQYKLVNGGFEFQTHTTIPVNQHSPF